MANRSKGLTNKQKKFIKEYLVDHNGKRAAIAAGYSEKGAASQANILLNKPLIKSEIEKRQKRDSKKFDISRDRVLNKLANIAFSHIGEVVEFEHNRVFAKNSQDLEERVLHSINSISEKTNNMGARSLSIKLHDPIRALELLGKYLGLFDNENALSPEVQAIVDIAKKLAGKSSDELEKLANDLKKR
jgi:phage terminase small subunit